MKKILILLTITLIVFTINVQPNSAAAATKGTQADQLIKVGKSLVGTPYRFGGTTTKGFDCSGFIGYVFNSSGKKLPRTAADMWKAGKSVKAPKVGDLVFFQTYKKGPSHAGIYIGNNSFIHASSSKGVMISKLTDSYYKKRYLGAKKI
ncbi:C40 family peptidase [Bacillus pinisoli]|uniref:C40 family peptidase n=1 Tax=Bacillus pinisoli TaxID=2901866 RepID=UPI002342E8FF|nr:C40 family peptidase [Bacillus pinisoli]